MTAHVENATRRVAILAAGGVASGAVPVLERFECRDQPLRADAVPVPLRERVAAVAPGVSRLASRFAQLAVLGAADCLARSRESLSPDTRLYLATGLGDVAHTDALYYEVMPPRGEMPQPARFATSGNNMAGFFVAQHAGLQSRNLTFCCGDLSFETALVTARDDIAAGACATALVGGVDETTLPREFYTRRYPAAHGSCIGEGSGWLLLGTPASSGQTAPIGWLLDTRIVADDVTSLADAGWVAPVARVIAAAAGEFGDAILRLLPGGGLAAEAVLQLQQRFLADGVHSQREDYLGWAGRFPTAPCLALAAILARMRAGEDERREVFAHVNRSADGRTGLILFVRDWNAGGQRHPPCVK